MRDKVIDRDVNGLSRLDVPQCCDDEVVVKRIWTGGQSTDMTESFLQRTSGINHSWLGPVGRRTWVVEVELSFEHLGFLLRGEDPVEAVLTQDGHLPLVVVDFVLAEQFHDLAANRRLAAHGQVKYR